MANELEFSFALSFYNPLGMNDAERIEALATLYSVTGLRYSKGSILVGLSEVAVPLGGITTPHWAVFGNRDTVITVQLLVGSGLAEFAKLLQSEWAVVPLDPSVVPYAVASANSAQLQYLIVSL